MDNVARANVRFSWVRMGSPEEARAAGFSEHGLKAAIDDQGTIWAWSGLLTDKNLAMALAGADGQLFIRDEGEVFLKLDWMRENLVIDETGAELADTVAEKVKLATYS